MKIAYLVNRYPWVSHSFIRREIAALEAQGVEVLRFSIRDTGNDHADPADCEEARRTRVLLRGWVGLLLATVVVKLTRPLCYLRTLRLAYSLGRRSQAGVIRHLAYLMEACRLLRWLRESGCEHVHAHFSTNPAAVAMFCHELGGPPYSITIHGPSEFDCAPLLGLDEKVARAKFVAVISSFCRSQVMRWSHHRDWEKIRIVRCGLDAAFLSSHATSAPSGRKLVCVGRLCNEKGQLLLVEAAHRLADEGRDFELVLVGDGGIRREIEAMIEKLGLGERVRITGWASNERVVEEIGSCRAMVLPSFAEGLPVVIMEAMALGRPVISTRVAAIAELVETGVTGWLIPPASVDDLCDAMREALDAPEATLEAMGRCGALRVRERHDVNKEAAKLSAFFREGPATQ